MNTQGRTSRLIQRRVTSFFEFGLPSPPWMAYTFGQELAKLMNPVVEQKWMDIRDTILNEIADSPDIVVHIPLWPPVGLEQGLSWLRSTVYEGYFVAYRVSHSASRATLWLKNWEFGEEEPEWTPA